MEYGKPVDYEILYKEVHEALMDSPMRVGQLRNAIKEHREAVGRENQTTEDQMLWDVLGDD